MEQEQSNEAREQQDLKFENARLRALVEEWEAAAQSCGGFFKGLIGDPRPILLREKLGAADTQLSKTSAQLEEVRQAVCTFINAMGPTLAKLWKEYLYKHCGLTHDSKHHTVIDKKR